MVRKTSLVLLTRLMKGAKTVQVNILEAKTELSKLIRLLESKREDSITVARNGKPVVKITLVSDADVSNRIGVARGRFNTAGDFDRDNEAIADLLSGGTL